MNSIRYKLLNPGPDYTHETRDVLRKVLCANGRFAEKISEIISLWPRAELPVPGVSPLTTIFLDVSERTELIVLDSQGKYVFGRFYLCFLDRATKNQQALLLSNTHAILHHVQTNPQKPLPGTNTPRGAGFEIERLLILNQFFQREENYNLDLGRAPCDLELVFGTDDNQPAGWPHGRRSATQSFHDYWDVQNE